MYFKFISDLIIQKLNDAFFTFFISKQYLYNNDVINDLAFRKTNGLSISRLEFHAN